MVTLEAISGEALFVVLRKEAAPPGSFAERVNVHSLRAGHATATAAVAG